MTNQGQEKNDPRQRTFPVQNSADALAAARARRTFAIGSIILAVVFSPWLYAWARFASHDELASYVLLIPVIVAYLIWQNRSSPSASSPAGGKWSVMLAAGLAGAIFAALAFYTARRGPGSTEHDYLTPALLSFLCCSFGWAWQSLGPAVVGHHAFAIGFLIFAVPLPSWAVDGLEIFFQHASAEAAEWLMKLAGLPTLRTGLRFQLPGFTLQVAQECSGIRSSLVLFIVSVLAGHLLLRGTAGRIALAVFVIPLGIVRNGFRILTIAMLCVKIGPHMIDSMIHHRGGPLFFALSLIPLFLFLLFLRWMEKRRARADITGTPTAGPAPNLAGRGA